MAVEYKSQDTPSVEVLFSLFEVPSSVMEGLEDLGVSLSMGINKLLFKKNGALLGSVPIASQALKLAHKGELQFASKQHFSGLIQAKVKEVKKLIESGKGSQPGHAYVSSPKGSDSPLDTKPLGGFKSTGTVTGHMSSSQPSMAQAKPAKPLTISAPAEVLTLLLKEPIALKDATELYQPVSSSSVGSKYFVIGIYMWLKLAARVKGSTISLRAEGDIANHKAQLQDAGFNIASNGTYASLHLECPTIIMARRIVGSVLLGLGMELKTSLPVINYIYGIGQ